MKLFLDTTIQYERLFGHSKSKEAIKGSKKKNKFYISNFILHQFKEGALKAWIKAYNTLVSEKDLYDALTILDSEPSLKDKYRQAINEAIRKLSDELSKERMISYFKIQIEFGLIQSFNKDIKYINDRIECKIAEAQPSLDFEHFKNQLRCRKNMIICRLPQFLSKLKNKLIEFKKFCNSSKKNSLKVKSKDKQEFDKLCNQINQIIEDTDKAKGNKCKELSDLIIALEAPKKYYIFTSNFRHFYPICKALNKFPIFILKKQVSPSIKFWIKKYEN